MIVRVNMGSFIPERILVKTVKEEENIVLSPLKFDPLEAQPVMLPDLAIETTTKTALDTDHQEGVFVDIKVEVVNMIEMKHSILKKNL